MGKEVFALNTVNIKINPLYDKSKMIPLYCHLVLVEWWQNKKIKCVFFFFNVSRANQKTFPQKKNQT